MPGSPAIRLLTTVGLQPGGTVTWRERIASGGPGVYVIETPAPLSEAPLDLEAVAAWIARVPNLRVDGQRPTPGELADRLREFWIPDEPVVYIGLAGTSLRTRSGQFYRTPLGDRGPHAGGHWLKTLAGLPTFRVSWAETDEPGRMEEKLLVAFADRLSGAARAQLPDGPVLPFANLETAGKVRKAQASQARGFRWLTSDAIDSRATSAMNRSTESAIARLYRSGPVKRPQERPRGGCWYRVQGWAERAVTPAYTRETATAFDALWRRVGS